MILFMLVNLVALGNAKYCPMVSLFLFRLFTTFPLFFSIIFPHRFPQSEFFNTVDNINK